MRSWVRGTIIGILLVALTGCEVIPEPKAGAGSEPAPVQPIDVSTPPPAAAESAAPAASSEPAVEQAPVLPEAGPLPLPNLPAAPARQNSTGPAISAAATMPALPQLPVDARRAQLATRLTGLRVWLSNSGRRALLLELPENFAWATFGGENQPVADAPGAALAILPDRALIVGPSDIIELVRGPLAGLGLRGLSYRWDLGREPETMVEAVRGLAGPGVIAADTHRPGTEYVADDLAARRLALVNIEQQRLAWLAATAAETVAGVLGTVRANMRQSEVAETVRGKLTGAGVKVADLRMARLDKLTTAGLGAPSGEVGPGIAIHVTAERWGLTVVVGRSVSPSADRVAVDGMVTARRVYGGLLAAVVPGKVLRDAYRAATRAATTAGVGEPFAVQPPGGVGAYRPFTRLFGPTAIEKLAAGQAAQITVLVPGAYLADTVQVAADGVRLLTVTPSWPSPAELVSGRPVPLPTLRGGELAVIGAEAERSATERRADALSFLNELIGEAAREAIEATPTPAPPKVEVEPQPQPAPEPADEDDAESRPSRPAGATTP